MINKLKAIYKNYEDIFKILWLPLIVITFNVWLYLGDKKVIDEEYVFMTEKTIRTRGIITYIKGFSEEVESNNGHIINEYNGIWFKYSFFINGEKINSESYVNGDRLRNNLKINKVPLEVEIEYSASNNKINRVTGDDKIILRKDLWDWFISNFSIKIIAIIFSLYFPIDIYLKKRKKIKFKKEIIEIN